MTPLSSTIHLGQARHTWGDGTFSDVTTVRFPSEDFAFVEIDQRGRAVKPSEIVHLRSVKVQTRGIATPRTVAFSRLERDRAASQVFPGVDPHTETDEWLYSANSLLIHTLRALLARGWLRYDGLGWIAEDAGGSAQLFYLGGLTMAPGNRYRMPGVQFERMVPSVGVLS